MFCLIKARYHGWAWKEILDFKSFKAGFLKVLGVAFMYYIVYIKTNILFTDYEPIFYEKFSAKLLRLEIETAPITWTECFCNHHLRKKKLDQSKINKLIHREQPVTIEKESENMKFIHELKHKINWLLLLEEDFKAMFI